MPSLEPDAPALSAPDAGSAPASTRALRASAAGAVRSPAPLKKPVNTLAIVPKSARITSLGRKAYNVLLYEAQDQGLDKDVFRVPLDRVVRGVDFDSNDHALIKKHLRAMVSTTVEWQSPTTGEGAAWNVSGLLAHARLTKERGQVWVEWSYAVNLKQELLEPTVFARLKLEIISQLRSHAGIALYEICTRYKDIGRTSRQPWRWWHPVLSGQPPSERTAKLEYRIFKRDTLKPAMAEVSAVTDLEVELQEHKEGRFISEIQFLIRPKSQTPLALKAPPEPIDLSLVARARDLGVDEDKAEDLLQEYGGQAMAAALEILAQRAASSFPQPLKDPYRYLRALMPGQVPPPREADSGEGGVLAGPAAGTDARGADSSREAQAKRQTRWTEEWIRRRREQVVEQIAAMSPEGQAALSADLLADMERRQVHPSIRKRLQTSGWQHPMVLPEMVRYYAVGSLGEQWDKPTPQQLLQIAAELGDAG
ncbi:replication initiation protein [Ideonella dechloratans]|uniref:Replication initiation protein n=1 Tax=Ideonella dechloratans TaxID=36863 RepID=A0A643FG30_IDEDE|nr:replication initiation protein [Ideonella dechloratans]KAB0584753.1 replication initiation protein [Ideonella dechloratans]UFU12243.1 replication initiation protein [Ideonella dechloratans]